MRISFIFFILLSLGATSMPESAKKNLINQIHFIICKLHNLSEIQDVEVPMLSKNMDDEEDVSEIACRAMWSLSRALQKVPPTAATLVEHLRRSLALLAHKSTCKQNISSKCALKEVLIDLYYFLRKDAQPEELCKLK